jgi:ferredoxin
VLNDDIRTGGETVATPLHVSIDLAKCCGYTACAAACPELYKLDEDGFAFVDSSSVPAGLENGAKAGAEACPEGAITLTDG